MTADEVRANMGLLPLPKNAAVQNASAKHNPYHRGPVPQGGEFTSREQDGTSVGVPGRNAAEAQRAGGFEASACGQSGKGAKRRATAQALPDSWNGIVIPPSVLASLPGDVVAALIAARGDSVAAFQ